MIDPSHITPTRWLGLLGFGIAAVVCGWVSRRRPTTWRALATVNALYFVEIVVGGRHALHAAADALLEAHHLYARREAVQLGLIGLLALAGLAATLGILDGPRRRGLPRTFALWASTAAGALLALEIVSLHAIDRWMYGRILGVLRIGVGWAIAGAAVTACALIDSHRDATPVSAPTRAPARPRR